MIRRLSQICSHAIRAAGILFLLSPGLHAQEPSRSVVQIQNQAEPGSGFFLKIGDKILFVTAKHVLGASGEQVILNLPDGGKLEIPLKQQVPLSGIDSAVIIIQRTPESVLPLEISGSSPNPNQILRVWGFPVSSGNTASRLDSRSGTYLGSPTSIQDGYSLLYGAQTQIGFSGGPILDELGMVVGMHGRSDSIMSSAGQSIRTGKALGIPIAAILAAVSRPSQMGQQIDEKALAAEAGRASIKRVHEIMTNSSLSDQLLEELERAEKGGIQKYCIEMSKAYYYTFFSSLPDLSKASSSQTITKRTEGVDPAYYALGSLVSRKAADFKKSLAYNRILEQTGNSSYLQYSERRLVDEVRLAVERCSQH
jgi:hypothetical protein